MCIQNYWSNICIVWIRYCCTNTLTLQSFIIAVVQVNDNDEDRSNLWFPNLSKAQWLKLEKKQLIIT